MLSSERDLIDFFKNVRLTCTKEGDELKFQLEEGAFKASVDQVSLSVKCNLGEDSK